MATAPTAAEAQADRAAARGDFAAACDLLATACAGRPDEPELWLKLAAMRRARHDLAGAIGAVDRALALDPLGFVPLLVKAGLLDALGRSDEAGKMFGAAAFQAPPEGELPPVLRAQLARARERHASYQADADRRLAAAMAPAVAGATPDEAKRIARFRGNALRLTRPFRSEPTHYTYPGLVEREFHDRALFPWLPALEEAAPAILAEYRALIGASDAVLEPYVQYPAHQPLRQWAELNHSHRWAAAHLLKSGTPVDPNWRRCPATAAALAAVPQPAIPGCSPNAMFSVLAPGARIPPHNGVTNVRLVCHLPLVVPPNCWFRVGAETRTWRVGEGFVFDDTIEHEAANDSEEVRAVLIFDVWHPGLAEAERAAAAILIAEDDAGSTGL
jgi:tetratricopeptide (TPR) repeat protein